MSRFKRVHAQCEGTPEKFSPGNTVEQVERRGAGALDPAARRPRAPRPRTTRQCGRVPLGRRTIALGVRVDVGRPRRRARALPARRAGRTFPRLDTAHLQVQFACGTVIGSGLTLLAAEIVDAVE